MIGRKLFSLVQADGAVALYTEEVDTGPPAADEVVVRIDAAPVNPSDLLLLLATADPATARSTGTADRPAMQATIPAHQRATVAPRVGIPMPVGNEGAGTVIAAGADAAHLLGKTVACLGRGMFAQYIRVPAAACHVLPDGVSAAQGAASLINPLTALMIVEVMGAEGHGALVHTAAASSLGQMLNRICVEDGVPLVNIVRRQDQADLLRNQGARHVCITSEADFPARLLEALDETGATIAFDAIGGGPLIGQLLDGMETVAIRRLPHYSRYGSMTRKTVYIYGLLDSRPIQYHRGFDFSWNVAGWLLTPYFEALSKQRLAELWHRISAQLTTTFATRFADTLSLDEMLAPVAVERYAQKATGRKFLIAPHA